jgi:outer membrane receptor for ferrienterochelin and colicins
MAHSTSPRTGARRCHRPAPAALAALVLPLLATAQQPEPAAAQRVEIRSETSSERRADTAGRQIVARTELLRHGDTRLVDALQRVPGVSVDSRGQGSELKLGGLGTGYTQVLLNGEPLPPGTALDSLALDSIERVEITRGSSVQSSQAIAGSINLVTRRVSAVAARDYKLGVASQWGRPQASAAVNLSGQQGLATWGLGVVLSSEQQRWPATFLQERSDGVAEVLTQRTRTEKVEHDHTDALSLNPRLAWKREDPARGLWQISTDHSLRYATSSGGVVDRRVPLLGAPPAQQDSELALNYKRLFWRGRFAALHRDHDGAQTEARLNVTHSSRDQDSRLLGSDFTPRRVHDSAVTGRAVDQSAVVNVNHQRPLGESHRLDVGAEWEQARRSEDRVQTEQSLPGGLPPQNLDERYDARVQRLAVYAQDDWTWSRTTTLQAGVRLEQLDTVSEGNVFDGVRQSHRLVGPVLRLSTSPSPALGTFKIGLSRGFKLPTPRDVMPRRYVPIEVSPTAPANAGNPDLRPERAWSLDGSWQQSLRAMAGEVVLSAAWRHIDDVILDRLLRQPGVLNAPWLLQRFNGGAATSQSLELELRGQAPHAWGQGAPLRWQASLALARSRLRDLATDRPALAGQAPWEAKLSLTQVFAKSWTAQLGAEARGTARADQPTGRRIETLGRHSLSAGLNWQPQPGRIWRLSATQLGANDAVDIKTVRTLEAGAPVHYLAREAWHRDTVWRLGLDSAF